MLADLLSVAGLTFLIMISPGPDFALVARNTVVGGKRAGGWTSAGVVTGNFVHLSYCLLGVGWLIANNLVAFTVLKLAGGTYLIFLGVQSLRSNASVTERAQQSRDHNRTWWTQGLLNNLLNPKGPLFYLGLTSVFVHADSTFIYVVLLVCTTLGVSAAFWVLFVYVFQISVLRNQLAKAGKWINRALGAALIALGLRLWVAQAPELP